MGGRSRAASGRMMLWFAATLGMSFAVEAGLAPAVFSSPVYAPLVPYLAVFALVSAAAGIAALAAAAASLPRVARVGLAVLAALPPLILAATFVLSGSVNGAATWGVLSMALLATAAASATNRLTPWDPLPTAAGTLVLAQGLLMLLNPRGFSPASYGAFTEWLWLWGPLFAVCGAGLLAGGRSASRKAVLAFTVLVALCLEVLTVTLLGTGLWSGVTIYGLLLLFLAIDAPGRPDVRRVPALLLLAFGGLALYHLGANLLATQRLPTFAHGVEASDLLAAVGLLTVAGGWLRRVSRPSSAKPGWATVLGALGIGVGVVTLASATIPTPGAALGAGGLAAAADRSTGIVIAGFSAALLLDERWPRRAWLASVIVSIAAFGVSLSVESVVANMLNLGSATLAPALSGGQDALDAVVLMGLSTAIGVVGITRAVDAPIGGRVFAAFSAVVVLAVMRSVIGDAAVQQLLDLPAGSPQAPAAAARVGVTGVLLLLGFIIAATVASVVIAVTITRPLDQLMAALRRYAGGDRTVRSGIAGGDEIGTVARTFDELAETLEVADARQRRLLTSLSDERKRLEAVVENALDAFVGMDAAGRIVDWSKQAEAMFGWSRAEVVGRLVSETIVPAIRREDHERGLRRFLESGVGPVLRKRTRLLALHRDGHVFPAEISITPEGSGDDIAFSAFIRDVSDAERREAELEHLALYDALTGVANRTLLKDRWELAVAAAEREGTRVAVAIVDLDQFKTVNDTLGHPAGDTLLREVSQRLRAEVRGTDTVARLGGDEFAVVLSGLAQEPEATAIAGKLVAALSQPVVLEGRPIRVTASAGVSVAPLTDASFDETVRQADVAMYEAKHRGGDGVALYSGALDANQPETLTISAELSAAVDAGGLWVAYQPIVDMATGRCVRLEALARWDHPERGPIPPAEFIPLAERSGLIRSLGLWMLDRALGDLAAWRGAGLAIDLGINVSMRQLGDGAFVAAVLSKSANLGLSPSALTVEVTESALMREASRIVVELTRLRAAGVRVAVDDFGTGYSSLAYLHDLPIDEVKIDRSLVADAMTSERAAVIVRAASALARAMALTFVAEGVEDERTFAFLGTLGGVCAQGFFIGRPMRVEELSGWLAHHERVGRDLALMAGPVAAAMGSA